MYELISPLFPIACEVFEDYTLHSRSFSRIEMEVIKNLMNMDSDIVDLKLEGSGLGTREMKEFKAKMGIGDCV